MGLGGHHFGWLSLSWSAPGACCDDGYAFLLQWTIPHRPGHRFHTTMPQHQPTNLLSCFYILLALDLFVVLLLPPIPRHTVTGAKASVVWKKGAQRNPINFSVNLSGGCLWICQSDKINREKKKKSILKLPTKEWHDESDHSQRPPSQPPKRQGSWHRAEAGCTIWLPMSGQNPGGNKSSDIYVGRRGVTGA
jgi:hypothetical protein